MPPTQNHVNTVMRKYIWRHNEIPYAEQFTQLASKLREDFVNCHPSVLQQQEEMVKGDDQKFWHEINGWVPLGVLYKKQWADDEKLIKKNYPTAHKLVKSFGDDCNVASYSILKPGARLPLHTGDEENRYCKYIRCHIPLIIPEGDMGLWVMGQRIGWRDGVFGFDNSGVHIAWSNAKQNRLVFIIDIHRRALGIPPNKYMRSRWDWVEYSKLIAAAGARTVVNMFNKETLYGTRQSNGQNVATQGSQD